MAVKNLKQAVNYLEQHRVILEQIAALEKKHKLAEMRDKASKLKAEVTEWAASEDVETIDLEGAHATLVRQSYGARWISTDDEIVETDPDEAKSLKTLIEEKFESSITEKGSKARKAWMKITRRVVDPLLLDAAVADKLVSREDIEAAYVVKEKAPYIRIFNDE